MSFGLVSIGVKAYAATEDKDVRFHQVHRTDGGRIRYRRMCEIEDKEVPYEEIAKGYPLPGGEEVILDQHDFDQLPLATAHTIEVLEFVPESRIDPIRYAKAYFLEPDRSLKPYVLLRDALRRSELVAVVKVTLRQREQLATLRCYRDALVLNTMRWPDEIRSPDVGVPADGVSLSQREVEMADSLVDSMTTDDFDDSQYSDHYRQALQELIDAKVAGKETTLPAEPEPTAEVIDLMAALQASVDRAKKRGERTTATKKTTTGKKTTTRKKTTTGKKAAKAGQRPTRRKAS